MRQMKSSSEIKQTVIWRQPVDMELKPYAMLITPNKAKTAVHAWLPMLGSFKF